MKGRTFSLLAAPLRVPAFRAIWSANVVSNVGTLMQAVAAAWMMTGLTTSTIMVGLVQTASTLPVFFIGLLAGAMADTVNRKTLLLWSQAWMMIMAFLLGILTLLGFTTPWVLLGVTFALGLGSAISLPAWQASVQDIVPREDVAAAVSLNAIAFNVARAAGPALGGFLVAATGPATAFLINGASFVAVIAAVCRWKPVPLAASPLHENIWNAIQAGFRYLIHARRLQAPIVRAATYNIFAGATWPLLPLYARDVLHTHAGGYGLLLATFGLGSIMSALLVPRLRTTWALDRISVVGTLIAALAFVGVSFVHSPWEAGAILFFSGAAWVGVLINFNVAVQTAVPSWVRGRAISFYLLTFQGVLAAGGVLWGALAGHIGVPGCFQVAAGGLVAGLVMIRFFPLSSNDDVDLRPSTYQPNHETVAMDLSDGPVLVEVEFLIDAGDVEKFRAIMRQVREVRLRDGARRWRLYQDAEKSGRFIEIYTLDSWAEHLRQHERATMADRILVAQALAYHRGPETPRVSHQLRLED